MSPDGGTPALGSAVDESVLAALMADLDPESTGLQDALLASYLDSGGNDVNALLKAVAAADLPVVVSAAHTLKSTSALLGATHLAELLRAAEGAAASDPSLLVDLGRAIAVEHDRVVVTFRRMRGEAPAAVG